MGPTNIALVKLFEADQKLREATGRLEAASRNVRIQERRTRELTERLEQLQQQLKENQSQYGQLDLDLKAREAHIEKLRTQQQTAHTNKEYQTFLIEINTQKLDKTKVEDEAIKSMEQIEKMQGEVKDLTAQLEGEETKLQQMRAEIGDRVAALEAEIESLRPDRQQAYDAVQAQARDAFDRLAERFEGEALSALSKPNPRQEEYICGACNMLLVVDVYNRLHTRDELVFCPSCRRILYIPEDLTPDRAVHKPKEKRAPRVKKGDGPSKGASAPRQQSAVDVMRSVDVEANEPGEAGESETPPAENPADNAET
ncbi:MAG TPA: C4-type zinc ribbon domain-containing protein [Tepidisphaeraceae bacterium]|nr:C4-type zinc ribbon domain-containing protein [Tepidisphaeraceae bacterium]